LVKVAFSGVLLVGTKRLLAYMEQQRPRNFNNTNTKGERTLCMDSQAETPRNKKKTTSPKKQPGQ